MTEDEMVGCDNRLNGHEFEQTLGDSEGQGCSDQISRSVVSDSLRPHESQHARPPCPSPTVVLGKTLESPLDCKEIQPDHSEGDQPWDFFGRNDAKAETPVLWPPHAKT